LQAVIYTDALQVIIVLSGGIIGAFTAFNRIGGWTGMKETFDISNHGYLLHGKFHF